MSGRLILLGEILYEPPNPAEAETDFALPLVLVKLPFETPKTVIPYIASFIYLLWKGRIRYNNYRPKR